MGLVGLTSRVISNILSYSPQSSYGSRLETFTIDLRKNWWFILIPMIGLNEPEKDGYET